MTENMKWAIIAVVSGFVFVAGLALMATLLPAPETMKLDQERYTICIEAGGEYINESSECDMP